MKNDHDDIWVLQETLEKSFGYRSPTEEGLYTGIVFYLLILLAIGWSLVKKNRLTPKHLGTTYDELVYFCFKAKEHEPFY